MLPGCKSGIDDEADSAGSDWARLGPQELAGPLGRDGAAGEVALEVVAAAGALRRLPCAQVLQEIELLVRFHALSDDVQVQAVREGHDGRDKRLVGAVAPDAADERAVDLDGVNGELPQVSEMMAVRGKLQTRM